MASTEFFPDFTPLNPAEREILSLLAQGHTAKSIASLTGKTAGSVNERLREARRKTGVASSRELARLFAETVSPKNRDEQIGVGETHATDASQAGRSAPRRPRVKGIIAMGILIGAVALGAAMLGFQAAPASDNSIAADPLLNAWSIEVPAAASLRDLHVKLRAETRDAGWAGPVESAVKARYARIVGPNDELRVTCRATLCEVVGVLPEGEHAKAALQSVQDRALYADIAKLGFRSDLFTVTTANKKRLLFVSYWRRA